MPTVQFEEACVPYPAHSLVEGGLRLLAHWLVSAARKGAPAAHLSPSEESQNRLDVAPSTEVVSRRDEVEPLLDNPSRAPARKPAVGYLRRSTDRQEQSLADQRRVIETYADRHAYGILRWFEDDAVSGASVDSRAAFKKMLDEARSPERDWRCVLVFDVSRFSRGDLDEAGHLRYQFRQAGVDVVYCNENFTGSDSDDLVLGVKQWQARQYVKDLSKVTIRGLVSHTQAGSWGGGMPPYGYDLEYSDGTGRPYQRVRFLPSGEKRIHSAEGILQRTLPPRERLSTAKSDRARLVPSADPRVRTVRRIFEMYGDLGMGLRAIASRLAYFGPR